MNSIRSPGCGSRPQKNVWPMYARSTVYVLYAAIGVLTLAGGFLCG